MVKSQTVRVIEDQGPLVHLKYKALTALISLSCGLLGQFSYDQEDLFTTPLGLEPQLLLAHALRPLRSLIPDTEQLLGRRGAKAGGDQVHPA